MLYEQRPDSIEALFISCLVCALKCFAAHDWRTLRAGSARESVELMLEVARDVIENARALGNLRIRCSAHRLEAHAAEAFACLGMGEPVLQTEAKRAAKALNQTRKRGTLFRHLDEDLARAPIIEQADREVTLVAVDGKLMRERATCLRKHFAASGGEGSR